MDEIKVSVIVPAYNTDAYIERMIMCLLKQTYKNLQLIFIDDGSTDKTAEIIKSFTDPRIEYYYQNNSGVSAARNSGLNKATGDKIFFFDSDDTFEPSLIRDCIEYAKANNIESVLYGYGNKIDGKITNEHVFRLDGIYRNERIINELVPAFLGHSFADVNQWLRGERGQREGKEHTALWRIMLDASVVKENQLLFDTSLWLGEDTKFINTYFLFTHSVGILKKTLYYLTIREGSANVTSDGNPVFMAQNKEKLIAARKEIDTLSAKRGIDTHIYWQGTLVLSAVQLALRLSHDKRGGWKVFQQYMANEDVRYAIKEFKPDVVTLKSIPFFLLRGNLEGVLYMLFKITPNKLINKLL